MPTRIRTRNLAGFKQALGLRGVVVTRLSGAPGNRVRVQRTVHKLQTNSVAFSDPSSRRPVWLTFGKAGAWTFRGGLAVKASENGSSMTYELHLP